jgi:uncharacterized repeat protein (TIGR03803 family)
MISLKNKNTMNVFKSSSKHVAHACAGRLLALFMLVSLLAIRVPAQTFNVIYGFNSTNATGYNPIAPVIQGPDNTLYGTTQLGGSGGSGVVFKVQPDGTGYTVLWNFSGGIDGANPNAGLLLSGNTLYGTTYNGGNSGGYGVIFAVNTDGSGFTNLYNFTGGLDCGNPYAGLILSGSTLYGTTTGESSGIQYYGSIFKINTNGSGFTVLKTFKIGDGTGANPYGGLVLSGSLLYGTTESGTPGYGTVFRLTTSGAGFTTLYSFTDGNDGGSPQGGLVLSSSELYGTTLYGGTNFSGTVFKINTGGGGFTVLHSFGSIGGDGINPPSGLILSGNILYGTASGGGSYNSGTIFSLNTNGSGLTNFYNFDGNGGYSPNAALLLSGNTLYGTASGGGTLTGGTLFAVALFGLPAITNQPLSQIVAAGGTVTFSVGAGGAAPLGYQWLSNNVPLFSATNSTLTLTNVSLAASGNYSVLVTNTYFNIQLQAYTNSSVLSRAALLTVVPVLVTNQPVSQIVPSGSTVSFSVGVAGAAPLNYQWNSNSIPLPGATNAILTFTNVSLAASAIYSVLITSSYGSVLSSDAMLTVLPASDYVTPTFWFGISSNMVPGGFWPNRLALDSSNNIYVTDPTSFWVVKFDKSGNFLTKFGSGGQGVAVDRSNNVYVSDSGNNRIVKLSSNGAYLNQWGSYGSGNGQFSNPQGVAVDSSNNVYVTDDYNDRIEKFSSSGAYLNQWGSYGSGNGQFSNPQGVAVDSSNNVYVIDYYNNRIEKFSSSGAYLNQWGSYGGGNGQFEYPLGVAVDSRNNVYVSDSGNNRVEKFTSNGTYLTQWGGFGSGNGQFEYPAGIAVDSSGNYIYVADAENRIQVFINNTNIIPPTITQSPASQTVAVGLNATFTVSLAGSPPFAYQWSSNNIAVPGATNASFTLTNVSFSAVGIYSVLVANNYGSALSDPAILTVLAEVATTLPATGISATGAVLNGSVTLGPDETLAWFEWGTDTNYGNIAGVTIVPGDYGSTSLSAALTGLPGNVYHYRLDAANDFGIVYGNDQPFTVGFAPTATTLAALNSTNGSTLNAAVNPMGWDTSVYFKWGASGGLLTNLTPIMDAGMGAVSLNVSSFITGLTPFKQYNFQAVASNQLGTATGAQVTFYSPPFVTVPGEDWTSVAASADGSVMIAVANPKAPVVGPIYISTNSGTLWNQTTNAPLGFWQAVACSADGSKIIAAQGGGGGSIVGPIYTSADTGATWVSNNAAGLQSWESVASSADGTKLAAAALGARKIYTSTNSGATWAQATNAPRLGWNSIASSADGSKLAAVAANVYFASPGATNIYTSTNFGATWITNAVPASPNGIQNNWTAIASSADGSKLIAAGGRYNSSGFGYIFSSTNFGASWTLTATNILPSNGHSDWICVASSADGSKLAAVSAGGTAGVVITSTNSGVTWTTNPVPNLTWNAVALSADGARMVVTVGYPSFVGPIFTTQTTPAPVLSLSAADNVISWIIPSLAFTLQQSPDLVNWTDVTNSPMLNLTNLQDQTMLPTPNGNSFFRLKNQ